MQLRGQGGVPLEAPSTHTRARALHLLPHCGSLRSGWAWLGFITLAQEDWVLLVPGKKVIKKYE